jgi:hypothetical protein
VALEQIERHFGDGLVKLIPPLWGKPVVAALLRSYLNRVQELENDTWEVLGAFDVRTCDATRLAILGRIVGQSNLGWNTETYRAVVRARIAANRSHGREADIVNVILLATGLTGTVGVVAVGFANLMVTLPGAVSAEGLVALRFLLPKTRAAGVGMQLLVSGSAESDETFLWGDLWSNDEYWAGAIPL